MQTFAVRPRPLALKPIGLDHYADLLLAEAGLTRADVTWWKRSGNGRVTARGKVAAPLPTSHDRLLVLAHEVGHVLLHTSVDAQGRRRLSPPDPRLHVIEYQAVLWSFDWFESHGLRITPDQDAWGREYVLSHLIDDMFRDVEHSTEVVCWIGFEPDYIYTVAAEALARRYGASFGIEIQLPAASIPNWPEAARRYDEQKIQEARRLARWLRIRFISLQTIALIAAAVAAWW